VRQREREKERGRERERERGGEAARLIFYVHPSLSLGNPPPAYLDGTLPGDYG
jgi:hypothetical protein